MIADMIIVDFLLTENARSKPRLQRVQLFVQLRFDVNSTKPVVAQYYVALYCTLFVTL